MKSKLESEPIIHFSKPLHNDKVGIRCSNESHNIPEFQLTRNRERVTCESCLEALKEDDIEDKLEEACEAYDRYMELRNELIEMDEMAADKLANWVDSHEG